MNNFGTAVLLCITCIVFVMVLTEIKQTHAMQELSRVIYEEAEE